MQDSYEQVTDRLRDGYSDAEDMVRSRPGQTVAAAFGAGVVTGLLVALFLRSK